MSNHIITTYPERISPYVKALVARGQITREDLNAAHDGRYNSYEYTAMAPAFTTELLVEFTEHALAQTTPVALPASYEDAIIHTYLPELLRRLKALMAQELP